MKIETWHSSDKTVKRWLTILENMYVIFKVPPFHKNIARAIQKEIHFREDCFGEEKTFPNGVEIRTAHKWLADLCLP